MLYTVSKGAVFPDFCSQALFPALQPVPRSLPHQSPQKRLSVKKCFSRAPAARTHGKAKPEQPLLKLPCGSGGICLSQIVCSFRLFVMKEVLMVPSPEKPGRGKTKPKRGYFSVSHDSRDLDQTLRHTSHTETTDRRAGRDWRKIALCSLG